MSILIKGMEMPRNCDSCRIMVFEDTNCVPELLCGCPIVFRAHPQHEDHRPDYCPLVEVPKHGRLIDADALNELIDSGDDIDFSEVPETKYAIMQMVNEQDTILEASPYRYKMIGKTDKPHGIYFIESEGEDG